MRFATSTILCLGLASSVAAAPLSVEHARLETRDLPTISGVLNVITADLTAMDAAVAKFDGNAEKAVPILDAAEKTLRDIRAGVPTVQKSLELNLAESIGILLPVGALQAAAKQLVTDIVAKKPQFESSFTDTIVQDKLGEFQKEAGVLVEATIKKIPAYLSIISTPIAASITTQLDTAAVAYGLQASPALGYAPITDVASSLGALFSSSSSSTPAAAAPAPAAASSSGLGGLAALFGGS